MVEVKRVKDMLKGEFEMKDLGATNKILGEDSTPLNDDIQNSLN